MVVKVEHDILSYFYELEILQIDNTLYADGELDAPLLLKVL